MPVKKQTETRWITDDGFALTFEPVEDTIQVTPTETGYEVRYLSIDMDAQSPDDDDDDGLFLVHYHQQFHLTRDAIVTQNDVRDWYHEQNIPQEEAYWIFAVAALIHSGVWLMLGHTGFDCDSQGWDTSHVGVVLAAKSEWSDKDRARLAATQLVDAWNSYLSGDVYGIIHEKFSAEKVLLDSDHVWGFVGRRYAEEELRQFGLAPCLSP